MTNGKGRKKTAGRSDAKRAKARTRTEKFSQISKSSSQIVREAAVLLDEEIAAGVIAAKQMQQRFQKERRIDPGDFKAALQRFQGDAHEVVNLFNDQLSELRSEENAELMKRLVSNIHDVLDLSIELVNIGAEVADQLVQSHLPKKQNTGDERRKP